ncbi:MAG: beta-lactamase family protein [Blastocatellia bacterium]|nr:beta-lactamase family protein [Blastocatellia bacterium]
MNEASEWQAGMLAAPVSEMLQARIDAGDFPSAVYLVGERGEIRFQGAVGNAVVEPEVIAASKETIYDVASLTKVLVTSLLIAKLVERGDVRVDEGVGEFLGAQKLGDKAGITIQQLLTHTSGLIAWLPFYLSEAAESVLDQIAGSRLGTAGEVVYSDLNFLLLEEVIRTVYGGRTDEIAVREINEPLGLSSTYFNPPLELRQRIAASEKGNEFERQTCIEKGFIEPDELSDKFRSYQIWGEVHDGNAWALGGAAGHAGLFSTAEEVFKIALQFLADTTTLLKPETCQLFRTNFTPGISEHRSYGFQLASTPDSTAGTVMAPKSFGHLGFTGTSLWIDPLKERVFILLTNRTHARPIPFTNINSVRRRFHDLAISELEQLS